MLFDRGKVDAGGDMRDLPANRPRKVSGEAHRRMERPAYSALSPSISSIRIS